MLAVANIVLPGSGAILGGFIHKPNIHKKSIMFGAAQLYTFPILFGWAWSIFHAYLLWNIDSSGAKVGTSNKGDAKDG